MIMGRWDKTPMAEIWHGKEYQDIRSLHENGKWFEHPICGTCEVALIELYKGMVKQGIKFKSSSIEESGVPYVGEDMESSTQ